MGTPIEWKKAAKIEIYPNPTSAYLKINYQNIVPKSLEIINSLGQRVRKEFRLPSGGIEISMSDLPAGVYHIHLNTESGLIQRRVVVIEN